jgi:hypothetical protein
MDDDGLGSFVGLVFPRWEMLTSGTVEMVTPLLVLVIWGLAVAACGYALREAWVAKRRIAEARKPIAGLGSEGLRERRAEIRAAADACPDDVVRHAWHEFDETLVSDGQELYNTVDAAEFFDEQRFAPRLVGNRFLHAAPTALTTIGLLGTFIGLTVGLRGLDLGSTADELRGGIQTLVDGAALGFTASLWGVFASLVTNVVERFAERGVVKRMASLQSEIDRLFQLRSPEQSLSEIASSTSESKEALQVLHEKIGSALQESIQHIGDDTSRAVSDAIQDSLAPIMADLAKRAADQSAEVFSEISKQLTGSFQEIGEKLAAELKTSSESMRGTLDYMGEQLARHADQHVAQMAEMQRSTAAHLAEVAAATQRQMTLLDEALPKVVQGLERSASLIGTATTGMEGATEGLAGVSTSLTETSGTLGGMLSQAIGTMDEMTSRTATAAGALAVQQASVSDLTARTVTAAELLREASASLNGGFDGMRAAQGAFLTDLERQLERHSQAMSGWLSGYGDQVSKQTASRMDEWNRHTEQFTSTMLEATRALSDAVDELSVPRSVPAAPVAG